MTLNQALNTINSHKPFGPEKTVYLACGFQALHLRTFLRAQLIRKLPHHPVDVLQGAYGDLPGNLEAALQSVAVATAVVIEWSDLDPRLGLRSSIRWNSDTAGDIILSCQSKMDRLETVLGKLGGRMPVAVAAPMLPLPPVATTTIAHCSEFELQLEQIKAAFLSRLGRLTGLRVLRLESQEDPLDARMELMAGFPYKLPFASLLAEAMAGLLWPASPKKGLITDLDDTLWSGLVGEVGPENVSWHQDSHTQIHGLYQQMLGRLAGAGVLLGIASKNEAATVQSALDRQDLLLDSQTFFPVCANWGPKSASVAEILRVWNIAPDSVVFVDDNPMELEEVKRAYPDITCLCFQAKDPDKMFQLLNELRSLFGKPAITVEDSLRQASIRAGAELLQLQGAESSPEFLSTLNGKVIFDWGRLDSSGRALELLNKTNQFNLNGRRISEGEWRQYMQADNTLCAVISYEDKFGSLGRVAVIVGTRAQQKLQISHWAMSCRAFSRRIEHHTIQALFDQTGVSQIDFDLAITPRNQPLREALAAFAIPTESDGIKTLHREEFASRCGLLPHSMI